MNLRHVALAIFVLLLVAPSTNAQNVWTGEAGDRRWDNPDNWSFGDVPAGEQVKINGPEAEEAGGPIITDGVDAIAEILIADDGQPLVEMTGGRLELIGWGAWWGDAAGTNATFKMSGGEVEFVGSPGIMELGWQEPSDPVGSSIGVWEMTGGVVFAQGVDMPGKNNGGGGVVNLWGGELNVGLSRGGLVLYEGALIDITEGSLILEDDQSSLIEDYADEGWITAYAGNGELSIDFDGAFTTVTASSGAAMGDFDNSGALDVADIDALTQDVLNQLNSEKFDLNGDQLVNQQDRTIWIKDLKQTWIGDADLDGEFNSADFVRVFQAGQYEDTTQNNSTWATGDWNGDGDFNSGDFVAAFQDGGFEQGPRAAVQAVPEPSTLTLLLFATLLCAVTGRKQT